MRELAVVAVFVGLFWQCTQLREQSVASYEMKSFRLESQAGCVSDTTACAVFQVDYPKFTGLDSLAQKSITERIDYWLSGGAEGSTKSMAVLANDFIRDFNQFKTEMPDYELGWSFTANVTVLLVTDSLISLQMDVESFTGGAHGSYTTTYINIEPKTGTDYLLDAFLQPGYEQELNRLGEKDFRSQRALEAAASLEEAGFTFPANEFKLNDNYGFRKEGVVFFFNSYEIAAYSEGPTEILIPYEELSAWRK